MGCSLEEFTASELRFPVREWDPHRYSDWFRMALVAIAQLLLCCAAIGVVTAAAVAGGRRRFAALLSSAMNNPQ
ncbi:hypothetical protein [Streptomyces sp. SJL17-4]|uniref:hypothetical protein n=1 Tax=Streptomyces sp. SJL17-4 TaxID=2967224 RepID=UPI0030CE75A3